MVSLSPFIKMPLPQVRMKKAVGEYEKIVAASMVLQLPGPEIL